jgi:hypothetical protein
MDGKDLEQFHGRRVKVYAFRNNAPIYGRLIVNGPFVQIRPTDGVPAGARNGASSISYTSVNRIELLT